MQNKSKAVSKKDLIVTSMAKKLADVSVGGNLDRKKKRSNKKRNRMYMIAGMVFVCLSVTVYTIEKSRRDLKVQLVTVAALANNDSPLNRLADALKSNSISVDQYALFLSDLLVRYDSLPQKFKTDRPVILNEDVYKSLMGVWMQLSLPNRNKLISILPALVPRVEKMRDSLRLQ